jgi:hypothetical protein
VLLALASSADARVKREGAWPDADKPVTLDIDGMTRREALRKLADAAGWSLVVHAPPGDRVDIHVKAQPAAKVLEVLLSDGDYIARRDGALVSIDPATTSTPATTTPTPAASPPASVVSPPPPAPPVPRVSRDEPQGRGSDRTVFGGDVTIPRGQSAGDVTVYGGNLDVEGNVMGDVTVFGGQAHVHSGGRVLGDATVFGGVLKLDDGATVNGDVNAVGGELVRDPGSTVLGDVSVKGGIDGSAGHGDAPHSRGRRAWLGEIFESFLGGVRLAAVLFVLGTILLALAGGRMDALRREVAVRPMRSVALGLLGGFTSVVVLIALCVTIIGAPIALVAAIVAGFAVLAAMCAVLSVLGEALLRRRTENPHVHLALGCAIFVVLSAIPWVGSLAVGAVVLAGVGVLVSTRGAGFFVRKNGATGGSPYRVSAGA